LAVLDLVGECEGEGSEVATDRDRRATIPDARDVVEQRKGGVKE